MVLVNSVPPGGGAPAGGKGVGEAAPRHAADRHGKSPARAGLLRLGRLRVRTAVSAVVEFGSDAAELVGQVLAAGLNLVLKLGQPAVDAALSGVYALLQALERAGDGDGKVVAALVNHALDGIEVPLFQWHNGVYC